MDTPHTTRHVLYRNSLSKKELERSHLGPDPENRNSDCLMSDVNVNCVSVSVSVHGNLFIHSTGQPRLLYKLRAEAGKFAVFIKMNRYLLSFCETIPSMSLATVLLIPIRPTRKLPWDLSSPICIALSYKQVTIRPAAAVHGPGKTYRNKRVRNGVSQTSQKV